VGAYLSHYLVHSLFGYTSIILALIIGYHGWHTFRRRDFKELGWLTVLSVWGMILLSTFIGWLNTNADFPSDSIWSGSAGVAISRVLQNITGMGSIFILSVLMIVTLLMFVDRDLQKTIDSVKIWMDNLRDKMEDWRAERQLKKEQKAKEREERIAAKKAEKEEQKAQQKAEKEETESKKDDSDKDLQKKEIAEPKDDKEPVKPAPSIDELVEKSEEAEKKKREKEKEQINSIDTRQRASLEKEEVVDEDEDDLEVSVFVGKGEEEADAKDLDKQNREKAKETPVIKYKFPKVDLLDTPPD
jgi:S-DNA-T family DNA segregation ATPase FtsK/SpoIIIE